MKLNITLLRLHRSQRLTRRRAISQSTLARATEVSGLILCPIRLALLELLPEERRRLLPRRLDEGLALV